MSPLITAPPAEPVGGGPARQPTLHIYRYTSSTRGTLHEVSQMRLSMAAFNALGRPSYVRIQYNGPKQMIRLQTCSTKVLGARRLRQASKSEMGFSGLERLIKYGGIRPGKYVMVRPGIFMKVSVDKAA